MDDDFARTVQFMFASACEDLALAKQMIDKHHLYDARMHALRQALTGVTVGELLETAAALKAGAFLGTE